MLPLFSQKIDFIPEYVVFIEIWIFSSIETKSAGIATATASIFNEK